MIKPTLGRIVLFQPTYPAGVPNAGPQAAIIVAVLSDTCVNLTVFPPYSHPYIVSHVPLLQDGDERPEGFYAEWMPYQKGQAAKTEALEQKLSAGAEKE